MKQTMTSIIRRAALSTRRVAAAAFAVALIAAVQTAWAADITQNTAVVINKGNKAKYHNKSITGTVPGYDVAGYGGTFISKGSIVVDGIELNLTIDGFNADHSKQYDIHSGISLINGAKLHLTVKGTNTLKGGFGGAGIAVPYGCTLEITAASTGTLNVVGGENWGGGAGIGSIGNGFSSQNSTISFLTPQGCGDIIINGGTVNAQGGAMYLYGTLMGGAAAIGSSDNSGVTIDEPLFKDNTYVNNVTGNITINGGTVYANGHKYGAAIGGGFCGTVKSITINGGNVIATAQRSAAIGIGEYKATDERFYINWPDIRITGGSVRANGDIGYGHLINGAVIGRDVYGNSVVIDDNAALSCSGNIRPSTQRFTHRKFSFTVYDASLDATVKDLPVQVYTNNPNNSPLERTAYCELQVSTPGIGTGTLDLLYPENETGGWSTLTVRDFTSPQLQLSESSHNITMGGYYYTFAGSIYSKDIALGTTATIKLDGVSGLLANATYTPETAGSADRAGVARFSGYFISPVELSGEKTFRVTDSNGKAFTKAINFQATEGHKSNLNISISDGSVPGEVKYIGTDLTIQTCNGFELMDNSTAWGSPGESWFVCNSDVTIDERITVNGNVNLILCNGATLTANKGITVAEGNTLNIFGQEGNQGKLVADARSQNNDKIFCAGIGGMAILASSGAFTVYACGNISIYGGDVTAYGGTSSAGIGGHYITRSKGNITIAGGIVKAKGGDEYEQSYHPGAGIGGGEKGNVESITISGGTVYAESGATLSSGAAGIGGGYKGDAGTIVITGGNITAIGKAGGCGIGPGRKNSGGTVSLAWTKLTDAIHANSYGGEVTFNSPFMLQGTSTVATTDNMADVTIVPSCTISFAANGGSGSMTSAATAVGATYELPECTFTAPDAGKVFDRWQIGTTTYEAGAGVTVGAGITVTALWREGQRTVTFDMNGHGDAIAAQTVDYSAGATKPEVPTATGYEFAGWYLTGATEPYNFNTPVTDNITLTAHWSKVVDEPTLTVTGTYNYTGKQIEPTVTVMDGETLIPASEYTMTTTNTTKAGTATVTITDKAGGDYKLGPASAEFTVAQKPVIVRGITASNKHYDCSTSVELDYSQAVFSGIVEGDVLTVTATGAFADAVAGEGKTVSISGLALGGRDAGNYVLAAEGQQTSTTATIYAPHTVTFADETGTALGGFPVETVLNGKTATEPEITDANRPAKDGYRFMGWNYNGEEFDFATVLDFETTTTVTLTARFLKLHTISIPNSSGGTVTANVTQAVSGETVTITATPYESHRFVNFSVMYNNGRTHHPFTMTGENEATFVMPDVDDLWVDVTFTVSDDLLAGLQNKHTQQYEVTSAADLVLIGRWMAASHDMAGQTIVLKNDIDVTGSGFDGFNGIYTDFNGTFDGCGHTISGISISRSGSAGVFSGVGGTVKDLTLIGSVTGGECVGGIAVVVRSRGTIENCVSLIKVSGEYVGGIAYQNAGTISDCYYLGGDEIEAVSDSWPDASEDCTALYAVTGNSDEYDGIVTISSKTASEGNELGGYFKEGADVTLTLSAAEKDGYVLKGFKFIFNGEDFNLTDNGDGTYTLSKISLDVTILPNYSYGGLSSLEQDEQNRYLVTSVADLNTVASVASVLNGCSGLTFLLANDIEFGEDDEFGGIGVDQTDEYGDEIGFKGTFDGGGHTISGMNISRRAKSLGFIGYLAGTLQNLTLDYCTVSNTSDAEDTSAGMLVGASYSGNLSHCRVIGGKVSGASAGAIYGEGYNIEAEDNLYNDEVLVVSGGQTKAPGTCATSDGDKSYHDAAVIGWRVIFLGDDGQLAPAQLVANKGAATNPEVSLAPRTHFTFAEKWKRGNGNEYTFDPVMTSDFITANTTLYPVWDEEAKYTVTYKANGGTGNDVIEQVYVSDANSYTLPECFYDAPVGKHFSSWEVDDNSYNSGAGIQLTTDITVKAQWEDNSFTVSANQDTSTALQIWNNQVANVEIVDRTLYKDGDWNTLCLPFNVTIQGSPLDGDGVDVRTLSDASFTDGMLTLNFTEAGAVTTLRAGVPYIIKWNNTGQNLTTLEFEGVTIDNTLRDQYFSFDDTEGVNGGIAFRGTYVPITYNDEDKSILFLGAANTLYYPKPGDGNDPTIGAFRAYFDLNGLEANPDAGGGEVRAFVLNFGDGESIQNGIGHTEIAEKAGAWFDLNGRRLNGKPAKKGLYTVDGKKVVVK